MEKTPGKVAALRAVYGKAATKKTPQRSRATTPAKKSTKKLWSDIVRAGVAVKGVSAMRGAVVKRRKNKVSRTLKVKVSHVLESCIVRGVCIVIKRLKCMVPDWQVKVQGWRTS